MSVEHHGERGRKGQSDRHDIHRERRFGRLRERLKRAIRRRRVAGLTLSVTRRGLGRGPALRGGANLMAQACREERERCGNHR